MIARFFAMVVGTLFSLGFAATIPAQDKPAPATETAPEKPSKTDETDTKTPKKSKLERATFGAGCFWSTEAVFERVPGVKNVTSGFSGGTVPNPSYDLVCTGQTGHAEVVHVEFDSSLVSYEDLVRLFFKAHDPTTPNAQGDDFGPQYRSVIFYESDAQRKTAIKVYEELTAKRAFRNPIVTELFPMKAFYPAEPYHQDYYLNHRGNEYSSIYIEPKLKKLHLMGKATKAKKSSGSKK